MVPAETGLVPQTVSDERLQEANALRGMMRNLIFVVGPAIGGVIVVAGSPGIALAIDAASFVGAALLLARIRIPPRAEPAARMHFLHELREGWREFTSRTWLWSTVVIFGLGNFFFMFWPVLGPIVAKEHLGGAGAWAKILVANGIGAVVGGAFALRYRPRLPLVACVLWPLLVCVQLVALALHAPTWVIAAGVVLRRPRDRHPPDALVHDLPARGARARPVARQLVRRARLVRPDTARARRAPAWSRPGSAPRTRRGWPPARSSS